VTVKEFIDILQAKADPDAKLVFTYPHYDSANDHVEFIELELYSDYDVTHDPFIGPSVLRYRPYRNHKNAHVKEEDDIIVVRLDG